MLWVAHVAFTVWINLGFFNQDFSPSLPFYWENNCDCCWQDEASNIVVVLTCLFLKIMTHKSTWQIFTPTESIILYDCKNWWLRLWHVKLCWRTGMEPELSEVLRSCDEIASSIWVQLRSCILWLIKPS